MIIKEKLSHEETQAFARHTKKAVEYTHNVTVLECMGSIRITLAFTTTSLTTPRAMIGSPIHCSQDMCLAP